MWAALRGRLGAALGAAPLPRGCAAPARAAPSCWSCGGPVPGPAPDGPRFCPAPACGALQPPEPRADFFRLMGCARAFGLDVSRLRRRFRSLQRALHPDYFTRRPQAERDLSQQHSALVNAAYQTLLRPLSRGLYLLELRGVTLAEGTDDDADVEFLAEIMDINERLADPEDKAGLQELESLIAAKQEQLITDVNQAFERDVYNLPAQPNRHAASDVSSTKTSKGKYGSSDRPQEGQQVWVKFHLVTTPPSLI